MKKPQDLLWNSISTECRVRQNKQGHSSYWNQNQVSVGGARRVEGKEEVKTPGKQLKQGEDLINEVKTRCDPDNQGKQSPKNKTKSWILTIICRKIHSWTQTQGHDWISSQMIWPAPLWTAFESLPLRLQRWFTDRWFPWQHYLISSRKAIRKEIKKKKPPT